MTFADVVLVCGYLASALVFAAFFMRGRARLRQVAIASNVAFIAYGIIGGVIPVLTLHALLLPLNIWRLREIRQTHRAILAALSGDLKADWLESFAVAVELQPGDLLFAQGDLGEMMYFIASGTLLLKESGIELGAGALVGEIALFSPQKTRTQSVIALSHARLLAMSQDDLLTLYRRHPDFGIYLLRLVASRLLENNSRLQELRSSRSS